jgi:hypothetical protein
LPIRRSLGFYPSLAKRFHAQRFRLPKISAGKTCGILAQVANTALDVSSPALLCVAVLERG